MIQNDGEDYTVGYLVGIFTVLIVLLPYAIALNLVTQLPQPYISTIGIIAWLGAFFYGFLRSMKKVERKLKRFFMVTLKTPPIENKTIGE